MVTGVRGLCTGLGPALFGLIFHIFNVNVDKDVSDPSDIDDPLIDAGILPGPPFLFGGCSVILAIIIAALLPRAQQTTKMRKPVEQSQTDSDTESNKLLQSQSI